MTEETVKPRTLAERKRQALLLRKAGRAPGSIAKQLGFASAAAVDKAVAAELKKDAPSDTALAWHELELARIEDLQVRFMKRIEDEPNVARDLMKLMDYRLRLQSARNRGPGRMRVAVERALEGLELVAADEAAKQSALDMATMIDVAMSVGTAEDQRRAINAMATMRNLLNDLGASPAAREELDGIVRGVRSPAAAVDSQEEADPEKGAEVLDFMARAQQRMKAAQ